MLEDSKRLYDFGFAIHWLRPKSKVPIESGWTKGPRADFEKLKRSYRAGYNVGVRLGQVSKVGKGYLAVIDCDVKSSNPDHFEEMSERLRQLVGDNLPPMVLSGRGMGSRHLYVLTESPTRPSRLARSESIVKVSMPSVSPSKRELERLTKDEILAGVRLRPAWEISLMGEGQQVVLPPSVHPDSGREYRWSRPLSAPGSIPFFTPPSAGEVKAVESHDFEESPVDLTFSPLSDELVSMIVDGEGCDDRSGAMFRVGIEMIKAGYSTNEILTVLTDRSNFLGQVAYEHAKTNNRKRAAEWVRKYTLQKAKKEATFEDQFSEEVVDKKLEGEEVKAQESELMDVDWRSKLRRNKPTDPPVSSFQNIKLVLENTMELEPFIARNEFSHEDIWTADTPWGCVSGRVVGDSDSILIKEWLSRNFRFEPACDKIEEVLVWFSIKNRFHPVREYLDSLIWDGTPRLNTWLEKYMGVLGPKKYVEAVGSKTILAMVARIYEPGCKFDNVLIFEGDQGIGKSTAARTLAGNDWFSDSDLNIGDKDAVINMQGIWVYELGELSAMSRFDVNRLKEFVSRSTDKIRPPYGRRMIAFPRQSIFIGTTNNDEYLKDKTGNRRYWPVRCGEINIEALEEDRDQLLAEAVVRYLGGEDIYVKDKSTINLIKYEQAGRVEHDELEDLIAEFLHNTKEEVFKNGFRVEDLMSRAPFLAGMKYDRSTQMRIGTALRSVGYEKQRKRVAGINSQFWVKKGVPT